MNPHNYGQNAGFAQPNNNTFMPFFSHPQQDYNILQPMFGYINRQNQRFPTPNRLQQQVPAKKVYIKKELRELFPDLDLSTLPRFPPHTPVDEEIDYVLENRHLFKKRISGNGSVKRKMTEEEAGTSKSDQSKRFRRAEGDGMMLSAFCEGFFELYETECLLANGDHQDKELIKSLLRNNFPLCNYNLIDHLIDKFSSNYLPSAVICFFVQSRFAYLVRKYFRDIEDSEWISMITLKTDQSPVVKEEEKELNSMITQSVKKFDDFMALARFNYPKLFDGNVLDKNAANMLEEIFECTVCFDEFPRRLGVSCRSNNQLESQAAEKVESQQPCSSKLEHQAVAKTKVLHQFCEECIRGQAIAATTDMLLVDGGTGLKCLAHKCPNSILFSECRSFIPVDVQTILNDRAVEVVLGTANIENLERCKRCAFAKEMDVSKEEVKVFSCLSCQYEYCRICEREWTDDHFGKKCEEVAQREEKDKNDRKKEYEKNEKAVNRFTKCPGCKLPFVKNGGCDHMSCRCGNQFSYSESKRDAPRAAQISQTTNNDSQSSNEQDESSGFSSDEYDG